MNMKEIDSVLVFNLPSRQLRFGIEENREYHIKITLLRDEIQTQDLPNTKLEF
jgi:hypothetical protein